MSVRIHGERLIDAPRERVYAALTDPSVVAATVPYVERFEAHGPDEWTLHVKPPLPLAPKLELRFRVVDKQPPERARLHAKGGKLGSGADVDSSFVLTEQ